MIRSTRFLSFAVCAALVISSGVGVYAQGIGGTSGLKDNLDLPFNVAVEQLEEEENAPDLVTLFAQQVEGDGFFFVVDRSTTMQDYGELDRAKREVSRIIGEMNEETEFGVVFFAAQVLKFPSSGRPPKATRQMKALSQGWIRGVGAGSGSCVHAGLLEGLRLANQARATRNVLIYIGDGGGTCGPSGLSEQAYLDRTRVVVKQQNHLKAQINTVGVLIGQTRLRNEQFLQKLAAQNDGTYRRLPSSRAASSSGSGNSPVRKPATPRQGNADSRAASGAASSSGPGNSSVQKPARSTPGNPESRSAAAECVIDSSPGR